MPNYQAFEIEAHQKVLSELKTNLDDKNKSEQEKLENKKKVGPTLDELLKQCDVAEHNNRARCEYLVTAHDKAKEALATAATAQKKLVELEWNQNVFNQFCVSLQEIKTWMTDVSNDENLMLKTQMVMYRGGWPTIAQRVIDYAPERQGALALRNKNRNDGISLSSMCKAKADQVGEYLQRAEALAKTIAVIKQRNKGVVEDSAKVEKEAEEYMLAFEKDAGQLKEQVVRDVGRVVQRAAKVVKLDKHQYDELKLLEPKSDSLLKLARGQVKTMKVKFDEFMTKVLLAEVKTSAYRKRFTKTHEGLQQTIEEYDKKLDKYRKFLEEGKKLK